MKQRLQQLRQAIQQQRQRQLGRKKQGQWHEELEESPQVIRQREAREMQTVQHDLELEELMYALSSWSYHSLQAGRRLPDSEVTDLLELSVSRYLMRCFEEIRSKEPITCLTEERSWGTLCRARELVSMIAVVALAARSPRQAVVIIEHGHSISIVQLTQYRIMLDKLHASRPDLVSELFDLNSRLQRVNTGAEGDTVKCTVWPDTVESHRDLSKRWNDVMAHIRKLPGFEAFLKPTPFETLQHAAAQGPVIIINVTQIGSQAIVILKSGEPAVIPLAKATPDAIESWLGTPIRPTVRRPALEGSPPSLNTKLQSIWTVIVAPVVNTWSVRLNFPTGHVFGGTQLQQSGHFLSTPPKRPYQMS
ncbi:hypothetical protein FRB95_005730 [Tulasnella sp. JGI-2019a]|nr:hypothetical protein FRB95_005730 [Tulasnella sp. JGI-2019a]